MENTPFVARNIETGEITHMTEEQVRAVITDTFQHDMPTALEYTDEEIAKQVQESTIEDHFPNGVFENGTYEITRE